LQIHVHHFVTFERNTSRKVTSINSDESTTDMENYLDIPRDLVQHPHSFAVSLSGKLESNEHNSDFAQMTKRYEETTGDIQEPVKQPLAVCWPRFRSRDNEPLLNDDFAILFFLSESGQYCRWDSLDNSLERFGTTYLSSYSSLFAPYLPAYLNSVGYYRLEASSLATLCDFIPAENQVRIAGCCAIVRPRNYDRDGTLWHTHRIPALYGRRKRLMGPPPDTFVERFGKIWRTLEMPRYEPSPCYRTC
jgi:hypothetical protein